MLSPQARPPSRKLRMNVRGAGQGCASQLRSKSQDLVELYDKYGLICQKIRSLWRRNTFRVCAASTPGSNPIWTAGLVANRQDQLYCPRLNRPTSKRSEETCTGLFSLHNFDTQGLSSQHILAAHEKRATQSLQHLISGAQETRELLNSLRYDVAFLHPTLDLSVKPSCVAILTDLLLLFL